MQLYRVDIKTQSAFYTAIKGDTLFGALCWSIVELWGKEKLEQYLKDYTSDRPFVVVSDAFPKGYLPKPCLPISYYKAEDELEENVSEQNGVNDRKEFKRKVWLPEDKIILPTTEMSSYFEDKIEDKIFIKKVLKTSNSVDPISNHASGGKYSAYINEQIYYNGVVSIYVLLDEEKIALSEFSEAIKQVGQYGYGKKASSGSGKFVVKNIEKMEKDCKKSYSFLTLAPCVPQQNTLDVTKTYYQIFVRFGRHGNIAALSECPFKNPVMTMDTGSILSFEKEQERQFIGMGIKGVSQLSNDVVFQGYAPVIPILAKENEYGKI